MQIFALLIQCTFDIFALGGGGWGGGISELFDNEENAKIELIFVR